MGPRPGVTIRDGEEGDARRFLERILEEIRRRPVDYDLDGAVTAWKERGSDSGIPLAALTTGVPSLDLEILGLDAEGCAEVQVAWMRVVDETTWNHEFTELARRLWNDARPLYRWLAETACPGWDHLEHRKNLCDLWRSLAGRLDPGDVWLVVTEGERECAVLFGATWSERGVCRAVPPFLLDGKVGSITLTLAAGDDPGEEENESSAEEPCSPVRWADREYWIEQMEEVEDIDWLRMTQWEAFGIFPRDRESGRCTVRGARTWGKRTGAAPGR